MVRSTFSPARAWPPAVIARLARTSDVTQHPPCPTNARKHRPSTALCGRHLCRVRVASSPRRKPSWLGLGKPIVVARGSPSGHWCRGASSMAWSLLRPDRARIKPARESWPGWLRAQLYRVLGSAVALLRRPPVDLRAGLHRLWYAGRLGMVTLPAHRTACRKKRQLSCHSGALGEKRLLRQQIRVLNAITLGS